MALKPLFRPNLSTNKIVSVEKDKNQSNNAIGQLLNNKFRGSKKVKPPKSTVASIGLRGSINGT